MRIVRTVAELPHPGHGIITLVPTMGAFHEGHLDLIRTAREAGDWVVVSLFVNPTQFGRNEDLSRYPRNMERDAEMAEACGTDVLFAPSVEEVYPRTPSTVVHVPGVTARWEGEIRAGHFDGVATVVAKLFSMVRPHVAYFGQKDLQQTVVVKRMVADLNLPVDIVVIPTTREADGLAMSSRNVYLAPEERRLAPHLFQELTRCANLLRGPSSEGMDPSSLLASASQFLGSEGFVVDYFAYVDSDTLEPITPETSPPMGRALIAAARLGTTRLIDNVVV